MSEDPTKDLTTDEILRLILNRLTNVENRLGAVETRLGALEGQGEDRIQTTRPLLNQLIKEMTDTRDTLTARADETNLRLDAIEKELHSVNRQFEVFSIDHMRMRRDIRELDARLAELESRPN